MQLSIARIIPWLFFFQVAFASASAIEAYEFVDQQQRERYQYLTEVLRCPKCQNQNLADSNSPISADLRREIYRMLRAGESDENIILFLKNRYGDFVMYEPPVQGNTRILWYAPAALMIMAIMLLVMMHIRASRNTASQPNDAERNKLQKLLADNEGSLQ